MANKGEKQAPKPGLFHSGKTARPAPKSSVPEARTVAPNPVPPEKTKVSTGYSGAGQFGKYNTPKSTPGHTPAGSPQTSRTATPVPQVKEAKEAKKSPPDKKNEGGQNKPSI